MMTLITLNDADGTYIRTKTPMFIINKNFQEDGYSYIVDINQFEHMITPKCISYMSQVRTDEAV